MNHVIIYANDEGDPWVMHGSDALSQELTIPMRTSERRQIVLQYNKKTDLWRIISQAGDVTTWKHNSNWTSSINRLDWKTIPEIPGHFRYLLT